MGGSSAAKRIYCPGSYELERQLPADKESEHAARGTALHEAMEYFLDNDLVSLQELKGREFYGWEITQELISTKLQPALDAFDAIIKMAGGDMEFELEQTVSLEGCGLPGCFGTGDVFGVGADERFYVIDWKFGDGVKVSPEASYQMAFYAAGALYDETHEQLSRMIYGNWDPDDEKRPPRDIVFCIVQPRVGYPDEATWSYWETTEAWVESFIDLAAEAYQKMTVIPAGAEPELSEGDHCRWCRANVPGICPKKSTGIATFGDSVKPSALDAVTLGALLAEADKVEATIKELRNFAHAEAERGVKIPGRKLVNKQARRKWTNEEAVEQALRKKRVKVGDMMEHKLRSPAQMQKHVKKAVFDDIAKEYVILHSSGTTLAPSDDKRPEVQIQSTALGDALQASLGELPESGHGLPFAPPPEPGQPSSAETD